MSSTTLTGSGPDEANSSTLAAARISSGRASPLAGLSDQERRELEGLRRENHLLQTRLMGVTELTRLLQEKTENCENFRDKTKRQEIAIVRLENRCANLDKKLRQTAAGAGGAVPAAPGAKSGQSPFIPGPSRQILEGLMKENSGLKKAMNNVIKKGDSGYLEAVKLTQLEEVIDQKTQEVEFMKSQIATLTANSDHNETQSWITNPGLLQRQLIKQQQAMKAKDRFCALLSDKIQHLQQDLDDTSSQGSTSQLVEQLNRQLEQEMKEKTELAEKNSSKIASLENEIDNLKSRVEDLNSYNDTLLQEKGQLTTTITELKSGERKLLSMEQTLQAAQQRHSADLNQLELKVKDLQCELDQANLQVATLKSLSGKAPTTSASAERKIKEFEDKLKQVVDERDYWYNLAQDMARQQDVRRRTAAFYNQSVQHSFPTVATGGHGLHLVPTQHMRGEIAVRDGPRPHPHTEPQPLRPNSCGTNIIETVHRTPLLNRDSGSDNDPVPPVTTTVVSHAPPGNLAINTQPTGAGWPYMTNAGQSSIPSPSRYGATTHPTAHPTAMTPGYSRPPHIPPQTTRMNSAESGYYSGSLPSGFSSMSSSSLPRSYTSTNPSLPYSYPHPSMMAQQQPQQTQQQQQQYDGGPQGQPLPSRQQPQGSQRYSQFPHDPSYHPGRHSGHQ